jgi:hypothetical protein
MVGWGVRAISWKRGRRGRRKKKVEERAFFFPGKT